MFTGLPFPNRFSSRRDILLIVAQARGAISAARRGEHSQIRFFLLRVLFCRIFGFASSWHGYLLSRLGMFERR
jgi:hypothetical protein